MTVNIPCGTVEIDAEEKIRAKLEEIVQDLSKKFPLISSQAMERGVKRHVSQRYPGSTHWDLEKIYSDSESVHVDIPGAGRAYHNVDIYPVKAKSLVFWIEDRLIHSKHVHQPHDPTLLPQMDELAEMCSGAIAVYLS